MVRSITDTALEEENNHPTRDMRRQERGLDNIRDGNEIAHPRSRPDSSDAISSRTSGSHPGDGHETRTVGCITPSRRLERDWTTDGGYVGGVTVTQRGAPVCWFPLLVSGGLVSSMLSFLTLMLMLPGMAAVAAYVTVAVSVWLEKRREVDVPETRVEARHP
ncbi:hypothetical protein [Nocardia paucivorans]|uniref:hypothetical protein n=1 Tax=Nocardia paucivorans TaxID=114259 RepID=UPI0012FCC7BF|nr:hypothetical protein [Nocardia paucivorans]